jgi:hypothetical protein
MIEQPMPPEQYKMLYNLWHADIALMQDLATCICGNCFVCLHYRPKYLKMEFEPDDLLERDQYESGEEEYYD